MSPFLYLLVVESMSRNLQNLQESSDLKGLKIARGVKSSNHVQFAGDTILLGGASTIIAKRCKRALSTFLKSSDSKVNSTKSKVYGWKCPPGTLENIARTLGFEGNVTWNSFNYLGIPIFKGKKRTVDWQGMIDKIKNKITHGGQGGLTRLENLSLSISFSLPTPFTSARSL